MLAQPLFKAGCSRCVKALMSESGSWADGLCQGPVWPLNYLQGAQLRSLNKGILRGTILMPPNKIMRSFFTPKDRGCEDAPGLIFLYVRALRLN